MKFICPVCGEEVPARAKACPVCGSDENTGWSEHTYLDGVDLGDDFDYNDTLEREGLVQKQVSWKNALFILLVSAMILLFLCHYVLQLF